jgi:hypothetical protein
MTKIIIHKGSCTQRAPKVGDWVRVCENGHACISSTPQIRGLHRILEIHADGSISVGLGMLRGLIHAHSWTYDQNAMFAAPVVPMQTEPIPTRKIKMVGFPLLESKLAIAEHKVAVQAAILKRERALARTEAGRAELWEKRCQRKHEQAKRLRSIIADLCAAGEDLLAITNGSARDPMLKALKRANHEVAS